MKIIVFTHNIPRPDRSSGERRFVNILELMAKRHEVDLCVSKFYAMYLSDEYQDYIPPLISKGIQVLPVRKGIVGEALGRKKYDIGFFEFYWIAEETILAFWKYQHDAVTIVDSVDVHFAREAMQAKLGQISVKQVNNTKTRELGIYRIANITLAASKEDAGMLEEQGGIENVMYVPNIVASVPRKSGQREPLAIFIGSFLWPPNVDAMKWFTESIWPCVYTKNHRARLQIIGNSPTQEITALGDLPGVEVLGFVPDTEPFLDKAAVSVAPLRFGGGMKGKVNEALAYGLPVVSTSIGAQGFQATNGIDMIVTDNAEEFAHAILELFDKPDLQVQIGMAGQMLNASLCSPEVVEGQLDGMMAVAEAILVSQNKRQATRSKHFIWKIQSNGKKTLANFHLRIRRGLQVSKDAVKSMLRIIAHLLPSSVSRLLPQAVKNKIWQ